MRTPDRWAGYAGFVAPPDRLVPLKYIEKYMKLFRDKGADISWYSNKGQGHNLTLTAEQGQEFNRFMWNTEQQNLPEKLTWATEQTDRYNRRSWLVIDKLESAEPKHKVDKSNILPCHGTRLQLKGPTAARLPWGSVDLLREGNRITATSRRVANFTLLISPDAFGLYQPVQVELNGELVFDQLVEPSIECLLKWAAVDDDRTLLFVAEISL